MLQYNKIYQSLKKVSAEWHAGHVQWAYYWTYLMFFNDGFMIEAIITSDNIENIKLNFSRENKNLNLVKYDWNNKEFNVYYSDGVVLHGGLTFENKIILQSNRTLNWEIYSAID